jgi:hypothetical protein
MTAMIDEHAGSATKAKTYSNNRRPVLLLELSEPRTIDYARNHIPHVKRLSDISANDAMQFFRGI